MPIVINLDVMMARRKMSLTELSRQLDISLANLSILKTGKARAIRFTTLEALCRVLECQPGDIMEYVDEEHYKSCFAKRREPDLINLSLATVCNICLKLIQRQTCLSI